MIYLLKLFTFIRTAICKSFNTQFLLLTSAFYTQVWNKAILLKPKRNRILFNFRRKLGRVVWIFWLFCDLRKWTTDSNPPLQQSDESRKRNLLLGRRKHFNGIDSMQSSQLPRRWVSIFLILRTTHISDQVNWIMKVLMVNSDVVRMVLSI